MKQIFTLLLGTILSIAAFAYDGVRLTIASVTSNNLQVEIDGRRYNMDRNGISLRDLSAGRHTIRIYRERRGYSVFRNNRQEVIYNQSIYLKRNYHTDITISRFGKVMIDERRMDRNDDWYDDDDGWDRRNRRNEDDDRRYRSGMSQHEFSQSIETLRREWAEVNRLKMAKQIIDRNYLTSYQLKEMMQLFTFEHNKLDLAKSGYSKVSDKQNFHVVYDALSMRSSREELERMVR